VGAKKCEKWRRKAAPQKESSPAPLGGGVWGEKTLVPKGSVNKKKRSTNGVGGQEKKEIENRSEYGCKPRQSDKEITWDGPVALGLLGNKKCGASGRGGRKKEKHAGKRRKWGEKYVPYRHA